jgi:hypothetical protein
VIELSLAPKSDAAAVMSKRRLPEQMLGEIHQRSVACADQLFDSKAK